MTSEYTCCFCGAVAPEAQNYCGWECMVKEGYAEGRRVHCPNGLPIAAIKPHGMFEHEHGDHPHYIFPVEAEYIGPSWTDATEEDERYKVELHALIYSDGLCCVTVYGCCYAFWTVADGECAGGSLWTRGEWRLSEEARAEVLAYCEGRGIGPNRRTS